MKHSSVNKITVIVPAAGIGSRMSSSIPKQYLPIGSKTVLEHTLNILVSHPAVSHVVVALNKNDTHFDHLAIASHHKIARIYGGSERVDSVLNGLETIQDEQWVMVHDAARPCLEHKDIDKLINIIENNNEPDMLFKYSGAILAKPAIDTMKQTQSSSTLIHTTINRETLWHALTPQLFQAKLLKKAIKTAQLAGQTITDEASAMEYSGHRVKLVAGASSNIKITLQEDLALAEFFLQQQGRIS